MEMYRVAVLCLIALALSASARADDARTNLLRNGSFEGGKRYWYEADDKSLIKGDAVAGEYALRIDKDGIASAAFLLEQGKPVTFSFSARSVGGDATMGWQLTPCSREIGAKNNLTWSMRHVHPVKITPTWARYTFTFTPTVAQDGFWPRPTYMAQIGDCDHPFLLDAVSVAYGAGADAYVPRREIEVQADSPDLKGYQDPSGNLLGKGATASVSAVASNPGKADRQITLRWQLIDYEGIRPVSEKIERSVTIPAGKVVTESTPMKLSATGLVLARVSAVAEGRVLDSSDLPLCSLPHPVTSARPDSRERFGGSLFGPHNAQLVARMGFAWSRWRPHMGWSDHQPDGPTAFRWFDKELDELEALGFSSHFVMYDKPKWAFAGDKEVLPKDMQWAVDDPRWQDPTPQCAWDRFVVESVKHYRGRPLVCEIQNEPEFDWPAEKADLYASFTSRTARLIKQTDAAARVMVNNVYGIPSGINRRLLEKGAGKFIDIISWHDYHEGWLADAVAIRRMRGALDDLGCKQIEIWFNEGWAFTNTAVDEPAFALTHLDSAQSTNAMVDCVAELTAAGQEKTILFHTGYENHGMSFWDYAGPGTMLWDYYGYPTPLVPAWNTLAHHLGLSERVGLVRPVGATLCIFHDLRNRRGVAVAYADREATSDVTIDLPLDGLTAEDAMGNALPLANRKLTLSKTGRPVFLYSNEKISGKALAEHLAPLDRKHASFVSGGEKRWKLPPVWEGEVRDSPAGNPAKSEGKPVWRLDQVWPADPSKPGNYRPLAWRDGWWVALRDGAGGQPKAELKDAAIRMEFRAPSNEQPGEKLCALSFVAPVADAYRLAGTAELKLWDGANAVRLSVMRKSRDAVVEVQSIPLQRNGRADLSSVTCDLSAGDELVLLPRVAGMFAGGDVTIRDLVVSAGSAGPVVYRAPGAWEGATRGGVEGNPVSDAGRPLWRLDQVWPDDPTIASHYTPLRWNGAAWSPEKNGLGGQPEAKIENGVVDIAVRGSWTGSEGQRIAGLVFIAPRSGSYDLTARASSKPWEGGAKTYRLGIFKRDTQRATLEKLFDLPRDGSPVPLHFTIDLAAGHELVLLPLMPDWHNATHTRIESLRISIAP